ncbi:MAG TPA: anti-sigma factor [Opitutaceae bacterium]|nr:anti-sigma factor [Opitutaceae bacterium]
MIDERLEELASLHAFGLLEGAELAAFEAELARNPQLRALVRELRETAGALALSSPAADPPPALKAKLLARIEARPPTTPVGAIVPIAIVRWMPWAAAACFALAAVWLGRLYLAEKADSLSLRADAELSRIDAQSAKNQLEGERLLSHRQIADLEQQLKANDNLARLKIARLVSLTGNSPEARAIAVWDPGRQEGVFTTEKLPAKAADQDYQLWVIDLRQPRPISAGVFVLNGNGETRLEFTTEQPVATAAKFAVSVEKKGGAPRNSGPQGQVIMMSE